MIVRMSVVLEEQHQRDIDIINRHAEQLNAETQDALRYQIPL